jgi:hypothetical protein
LGDQGPNPACSDHPDNLLNDILQKSRILGFKNWAFGDIPDFSHPRLPGQYLKSTREPSIHLKKEPDGLPSIRKFGLCPEARLLEMAEMRALEKRIPFRIFNGPANLSRKPVPGNQTRAWSFVMI